MNFLPKYDLELERRGNILLDIRRIKSLLERRDCNNEEDLRQLHMELDGKYQAKVKKWGEGMCDYNIHLGFNYKLLDSSSLIPNLSLMKAKLEGLLLEFNVITTDITPKSQDVNVTVNNIVNITISFEEAKRKIEEMPGLTDSETEEIKSKIDELEQISKEDVPKKKKWEKIKPILVFVLDKGADVAVAIMGLILQMKLGV